MDRFAKFTQNDLRDYPKYKNILEKFKEYYEITSHNYKEIDMYLWQLGKKFFFLKNNGEEWDSTPRRTNVCRH